MKKMAQQSDKNSPEEYDRIYFSRKEKGVDDFDKRRWKKLLKYYRGGKLLDVGCLDSLVPDIAKKLYPKAEVWGIDVAEQAVKDMQERFPDVVYRVEDAYQTKFPKNYFDYIVAGEIIEHLEEPDRFLSEMLRILKHGGCLAISTPENEAIEPGAVDGERHLWSWTVGDIQDWLDDYGTAVINTMGSEYFPVYKYHFPNILAYLFKK